MEEKLLLLGDQAVALGAIHAGITGVYAYPGTPSTEITEYIQTSELATLRGVHSRWCTNEKTAMEAALGVSYVGKRALVCMKHVGLNVAADAFVNSAVTGTNGGLVVLVADDPSMHSSQNEQDSRFYGKFAFTPMLEPSSQQEAYDMMSYAFDLSEQHKLPVLMRITTRMAHSRAVISPGRIREQNELGFPDDAAHWVLLPVNARRCYGELLGQQPALEALAAESSYNSYTDGPNRKTGVIACGIGYNYLMENFPAGCDFPVLKLSQYPLPKTLVRHIVQYVADTCGNDTLRDVLVDILDTPVSPELLPTAADGTIAQQTEKLVGPYELHDFFLYHLLRFGSRPRKLFRMAKYAYGGRYPDDVIRHWLKTFCRRFFQQQFKRSCIPDGPKVGSVTLSPRGDWRMPSDASGSLWLAEAEAL